MKKKLFRLVMLFVASVLTNNAFAQGSLLATLNHEGTVSTFYGAQAWRQAHDAATHGDVITLSSGSFVPVDITKAVTVRGAGMGIDTTSVVEPTVISGDFTINIPEEVTNRLTIEGIYHNHNLTYKCAINAQFLKCRLKSVDYGSSSSGAVLKDACFIHCRIADELRLNSNCSATCINSVIQDPYSYSDKTSNFGFIGCVIVYSQDSGSYYGNIGLVKSSSYNNCILISRYSNGYISSSCTAYNCIGFGSLKMFNDITNATNKYVSDYATVFKTYRGETLEKLDSEQFLLTDDAKSQYLGGDGTEVGIYGGNLPFDPTTSNPQITKCNVAAKSTADGKLSVDIEVNAVE